MANYNMKEVQTKLNEHGYNLVVDGIEGPKTKNALMDFQQKNGLKVDGILGPQTYAKLTSSATGAAASTPKATTTPTSFTYAPSATTQKAEAKKNDAYTALSQYTPYQAGTYTQSAAVQDLWNQALNMSKPTFDTNGASWQKVLDASNALDNRKEFSYDLNGDALYQQYKDKYIQQGKLAMMDTMGQAAALTGGYGNSYAATVGNQAYQAQLQNLNDIVPELYQLAYDRYKQEGQDLENAYNRAMNMHGVEYGQYRDTVSDYYNDKTNALNMYGIKSGEEYGQWHDAEQLNQAANSAEYKYLADKYGWATDEYNNERTFDYGYKQDVFSTSMDAKDKAKDDVFAMVGLGVMPSDDLLAQAGIDRVTAQALKQASAGQSATASGSKGNTSGNTSGNTGGNTGGSYDNQGLSADKVKSLQSKLGVSADGMAGQKTMAAVKKAGYSSLQEAYNALVGVGGPGSGTGFTGTTYSEAVAYMKKQGVPNAYASNIKTRTEWGRSSGDDKKLNGTYEDYLSSFVEYALENKVLDLTPPYK